ncbi:MAG: YbaB/EbfC family nucleoid-associated protein [Saprospiraceae bacterium]|nr:YbaB/EbfC family nucleoid-associated protein [Saprospiraceae bacterium]
MEDIFQGMEEQQKVIKQELSKIIVEGVADGISISANGNRQITNIEINNDDLLTDKEQLIDLLIIAINRALEEASLQESKVMEKALSSMLPPNFNDMFGK